jgi:outer membrane protein
MIRTARVRPSTVAVAVALCLSMTCIMGERARASNLAEVLRQALTTSPLIHAARARLRATTAALSAARSGHNPRIDLEGLVGRSHWNGASFLFPVFPTLSANQYSYGVTLTQPIYQGGRVQAAVRAARDTVAATLASYRSAEEHVLYEAAAAYARLYLAKAVVKLVAHDRMTLLQRLRNVTNELRNGEATRTDVSEAKARLEEADARLISARGRVDVAAAFYREIVGRRPPRRLLPPTPLGPIPRSLVQAQALAGENFTVVQARFARRVSQHRAREVRSGFYPRVALSGGYIRAQNPEYGFTKFNTAMIELNINYPIYSGGQTEAQEREAREEVRASRANLRAVLRAAHAQATAAWMDYLSQRAEIHAYASQVRAEIRAYRGVVVEHRVGTRTFLDVLNAEQELLRARVDLVRARVDTTLARFRLQESVGLLTPYSVLGARRPPRIPRLPRVGHGGGDSSSHP